jgi:Asp-tRNA(Asn)/Glu-tRNA(Gln) amidotransferase A subunit family amidase
MKIPSNYLTATEAQRLIVEGQLTVEQVAKDHLERYRRRNDRVKAWAYIDEHRILAEARKLDAIPREQRGPLFGVVLGVKDMMGWWSFVVC